MEERDLAAVLEIEHLSFPNPWHESTFRGEMQHRPISFPLVVVHKTLGQVIGYVIFWIIGEDVQINNIAVHPDFRGMGIGGRVLRHVIGEVRLRGAQLITLEVRPSNTAALSLYKTLGFKTMGIRKGYYTMPPEDAIVLGLHLRDIP
jgi:[ribosomal protein S18]-alanine N-acetyltransferase